MEPTDSVREIPRNVRNAARNAARGTRGDRVGT